MLVIPISNNILYVEPVYITSGTEDSALPQLARIVVSYNEKVVSEPTLNRCFERLFGVKRPDEEKSQEYDVTDYIRNAVESYNRVKNSSLSGDWAEFGKAMEDLDNDMNNLSNQVLNENENAISDNVQQES
ncbi:MAG: hypothetical protein IJQ28_01165 [Clostridia bacterium]|nr:hypothetical protein [Clostridia bacterium]